MYSTGGGWEQNDGDDWGNDVEYIDLEHVLAPVSAGHAVFLLVQSLLCAQVREDC